MKPTARLITVCIISACTLGACHKKAHPAKENSEADKKITVVKKVKMPTPKVIVVNDAAAKKTPDGRFYYDLDGKRYWRNNRDGKYYLFNKGMYNNPDFKGVN
jgi:hypothetical protein